MSEPTLPGFVEWLQRKDPNERYEWPKSNICACGQYAESLGKTHWIGTGNSTWSKLNRLARGPGMLGDYEIAPESEWTFGKLLERAKKELEPVS